MLGEHYDDDDTRVILDVEFEFSHLSQDKSVAVFKVDCAEEIGGEVKRRLKGVTLDDINEPKHYVQVHRELNDTPIPGLSIDYEKLELSCDWHGLFTRFYGEEMLYHTLQAAWVEEKKDWTTNMGKMALRGQLDMMQLIQKAVHAFGDAAEESRYKARKARQRRQYKERGEEFGELGEPEEKALVKQIAKARQLASMEDDSDYEDDEVDEEDDDESDEWQTDGSEDDDENDEENEELRDGSGTHV